MPSTRDTHVAEFFQDSFYQNLFSGSARFFIMCNSSQLLVPLDVTKTGMVREQKKANNDKRTGVPQHDENSFKYKNQLAILREEVSYVNKEEKKSACPIVFYFAHSHRGGTGYYEK